MDSKTINEIALELLKKYDCPNALDKHRHLYESTYGKDDYEKIEIEFGRLWFQKNFPDPDAVKIEPRRLSVDAAPKIQTSKMKPEKLAPPKEDGWKTGPMTEEEIGNILKQIIAGRGSRNASYRCCGKKYKTLFTFRKHLFECHIDEYNHHFLSELHGTAPNLVRGVGVKVSKKPKSKKGYVRNQDAYPTRCVGDHFHIIYTPMGNKR